MRSGVASLCFGTLLVAGLVQGGQDHQDPQDYRSDALPSGPEYQLGSNFPASSYSQADLYTAALQLVQAYAAQLQQGQLGYQPLAYPPQYLPAPPQYLPTPEQYLPAPQQYLPTPSYYPSAPSYIPQLYPSNPVQYPFNSGRYPIPVPGWHQTRNEEADENKRDERLVYVKAIGGGGGGSGSSIEALLTNVPTPRPRPIRPIVVSLTPIPPGIILNTPAPQNINQNKG